MIALFDNARAVIRAERACRDAGVQVAVVPLPESLSSECGMCLRVEPNQRQKFEELMLQLSIPMTMYAGK